MGDRFRAQRKKARQAEYERRRNAWLASPAGKEFLARVARREEREKYCCVCRTPVPADRTELVDGVRTALPPGGYCSWGCAVVRWLYLDELEAARRAGMPVAEWRSGPGADEHARYLNLRAERVALVSATKART
jgi:hypothetical protein